MDNKKAIEIEFDIKIKKSDIEIKKEEKEELEAELRCYSDKSSVMTLVLTFFPILGLHRITNGKILSGILFACTAGGLFIWWIIDMIMIVSGKFTDQYGLKINSSKVAQLELEIAGLEEKISRLEEEINSLEKIITTETYNI